MVAHNSPHKSSKTSQETWGIQHTVTSPTNAQSNGQAEHFVQTIKNSLTKAIEGGEDPHLAILTYITTPLNHSLPSPAELLNSRNTDVYFQSRSSNKDHTHWYRNIMQRQKTSSDQILQQKMPETYPVSRLEDQSMYNWYQTQETGNQDTSSKD